MQARIDRWVGEGLGLVVLLGAALTVGFTPTQAFAQGYGQNSSAGPGLSQYGATITPQPTPSFESRLYDAFEAKKKEKLSAKQFDFNDAIELGKTAPAAPATTKAGAFGKSLSPTARDAIAKYFGSNNPGAPNLDYDGSFEGLLQQRVKLLGPRTPAEVKDIQAIFEQLIKLPSQVSIQRVVGDGGASDMALTLLDNSVVHKRCPKDDTVCSRYVTGFVSSPYSRIDQLLDPTRATCNVMAESNSSLGLALALGRLTEKMLQDEEQLKRVIDFHTVCFEHGYQDLERAVMGIVVDKESNAIVGSGTLVDASTVLTARHVIYRLDQPITKRNLANLRFILAKRPSELLEITDATGPTPDFELSDQDQDRVELTLKSPVTDPTTFPKRVALMPSPVRLRIVGISIPWMQAVKAKKHPNPPPGAVPWEGWENYIVADNKFACVPTYMMKNGCMLHSCTTEGGMSGASVLLGGKDGQPLQIVAVHSGGVEARSTCSPPFDAPSYNAASLVLKPQ